MAELFRTPDEADLRRTETGYLRSDEAFLRAVIGGASKRDFGSMKGTKRWFRSGRFDDADSFEALLESSIRIVFAITHTVEVF